MNSTIAIILLITFGLIMPVLLIFVMLKFTKSKIKTNIKNKEEKTQEEIKNEIKKERAINYKSREIFGCFSLLLFIISVVYSIVVFIKDGSFGDLYSLFNLNYPITDYKGINKILNFFYDMPLPILIIILFFVIGLVLYEEYREIEEKYKKIN